MNIDDALRRIGREHERPASRSAAAGGRSVIEQPGRLLADGSRRGGRTARKATFYLELATATRLKAQAAEEGVSASDVVERALVEYFSRSSSRATG